MEIIVLPYIAVSFAIGWAIFSPFSRFEDLGRLTLDRLATSDLLAMFLPISLQLTVAKWTLTLETLSVWTLVAAAVTMLMFTTCGLVVGLFLLDKMSRTTSLKRIAVIGVIIPLGAMLTIAWIAFPFIGYAYSISYTIPATLSVVLATLLLRWLSVWVCHPT